MLKISKDKNINNIININNIKLEINITSERLVHPQSISQRAWDTAVTKQTFQSLLDTSTKQYHRARLLAAAAAHSGDWLSAVPITACGLHLSDEAVRVAVGLWLGTKLGQAYQCISGDSRHQGLTRLLVHSQPGENPATSLHQRPNMARNDKGWNSLS